jgi:hypothetical protein
MAQPGWAIIASSLASGIVGAIIVGMYNLRIKRNEYANDYYKTIITRRIGAYEQLEKLVVAIKTAVTDENDNEPYHLLFSKDDDWQSAYNLLFNVMSQALWLSNEAFEKTRDLNYRIFRRRPEGGAIEFGKQNYQFIATLRSELERILADDMLALHDVKRFLKQKRKKDEGFHQVLLPRA